MAFVNRFPQGYIYVSGDFAQPINIEDILKNLFYTWGNGISAPSEGGFFSWFAASPYYLVFYFLPHKLGFSDTNILSYVLFLFLSLSYFSFLSALKLIYKQKITLFARVFSLLYSINLTTIYFFTYTWGFSHQVSLYITVPLLGAVFYSYISKPSSGKLLAFLLLLLLSIPGFTNVAFFASLCLFLFLFLVFSVLFKLVAINRKFLAMLSILFVCSLFTLSVWLLPTYMALSGEFSNLAGGMFDFYLWLRTQSADILSIFAGLPGIGGFFPFSHGFRLLYLFPFIPILLVTIFFIKSRNEPVDLRRRLSLVLLSIYIIFVFLIKKGQDPFGEFTLKVFTVIPLLSIFRSYEKIALFMPFIILTALYGLVPIKYTINRYCYLVVLAALLAGTPFLTGGVQTKYSITLGDDPTKDYTSARYSGLVKIPPDYYKIAEIVNVDKSDTKVQDLPYSVLNTTAWVNYTKWKLIGFNVTQNLLLKPTIGQNASQLNLLNWSPTLELSTSRLKPEWYIKLLSYFNVSHIVYHKDVDDRFIPQSLPKVEELERAGLIHNLYNGEWASLYKLDTKYILPRFYVPDETLYIQNDVRFFPYLLGLPNYNVRTNYLFSNINKPPLPEQKANTIVILEESPSIKSLADNMWNPLWMWPPPENSKNQVEIQLRLIAELAFDVKSQNMYNNPIAQAELVSALNRLKLAVEREQETYNEVTDKNMVVEKVLKHLIMINMEYGSKDSVSNFFLPLVHNFDAWYTEKVGQGCLYSCYPLDIPETGTYEILVESGEDVLNNARLYLRNSSGSREILRDFNTTNPTYVSYGVHPFTKGDRMSLGLDHPPRANAISVAWEESVVEGKKGISKNLLGLQPSQKYYANFNYSGDSDTVSYTITENTLDSGVSGLHHGKVQKKISANQYFFTENTAGTGKITFYDRTGKDVDPKYITNLTVEKITSPKIILKQVSPSDDLAARNPEIQIERINPTKYRIMVSKVTGPYSLVFSESYHPQWKLYLGNSRKEIAREAHFKGNGYANYWVIEPQDTKNLSSYELIVEFKPQRMFYLGLAVSFSTLFVVACVFFVGKFLKGRNNHETA